MQGVLYKEGGQGGGGDVSKSTGGAAGLCPACFCSLGFCCLCNDVRWGCGPDGLFAQVYSTLSFMFNRRLLGTLREESILFLILRKMDLFPFYQCI